jgi:hypothetical protein
MAITTAATAATTSSMRKAASSDFRGLRTSAGPLGRYRM